MKACCFTGYRPEKFPFEFNPECREYVSFENDLISAITSALADGYDTFYCGGAMGFDILAAELLNIFRRNNSFRLVLALPFCSQSKAFPSEWKERYAAVLSSADEIVYVSQEYHRGCYLERNRFMVDNSDRVITFYDGKKGGTRNTVLYARKKEIEIVNLAEKENLNYTIFEVIE